jgi:hypothetical protein
MHACSEEFGAVFLHDSIERGDGVLHGFLEFHWCFEGLVSFDFHYVELHFFAKSEVGQFDEVYGFSAVRFDDFVADWEGF